MGRKLSVVKDRNFIIVLVRGERHILQGGGGTGGDEGDEKEGIEWLSVKY